MPQPFAKGDDAAFFDGAMATQADWVMIVVHRMRIAVDGELKNESVDREQHAVIAVGGVMLAGMRGAGRGREGGDGLGCLNVEWDEDKVMNVDLWMMMRARRSCWPCGPKEKAKRDFIAINRQQSLCDHLAYRLGLPTGLCASRSCLDCCCHPQK